MKTKTPLNFPHLEAGLPGLSPPLLLAHRELYYGYVAQWNELATGQLMAPLDDRVGFLANAIRLHENFFASLTGSRMPSQEFYDRAARSFGSWEAMLAELKNAALVLNPSWALLVEEADGDGLEVYAVREHHIGVPVGHRLVFALDGWEHAYGLDYGIAKEAYLEAALNNVDWLRVDGTIQPGHPEEQTDEHQTTEEARIVEEDPGPETGPSQ